MTPAPPGKKRRKRFSSTNFLKHGNEIITDWKTEKESNEKYNMSEDYWGEDNWKNDDGTQRNRSVSLEGRWFKVWAFC